MEVLIREAKTEIFTLNCLVNKVNGKDGGPGFVKRVLLAVKGFERDFKEQAQRIDRLQLSLQTYLSERQAQIQQHSQLLKRLKPSTANFTPEKLHGTLEWIWSHPLYSCWASTGGAASLPTGLLASAQRTLIIHGVKGSGKSVLAASVARDSANGLLKSLPVAEQTRQIPHLLACEDLASGKHLVIEIVKLSKQHSRPIYCILDGIDKSLDDWNDFNGGPLSYITKLLQDATHIWLLLIDLEARSTVMFLWIKLVFKELRSSYSTNEVECTLQRVPDQLDREYHRLFFLLKARLHGRPNKISVGMERTRGLLRLIVGASRPLTVMELRLAYSFSQQSTTTTSMRSENIISDEGIIASCGDFITIQNNYVCLGHTSIRQFPLRPAEK
ncbi:hypothetical protein B0T21DRAFT_345493 [Apiosordaria backusii]|uniref:Uncharacterized protein n=1 Tax=Apiosordaria backusii TaxID=314023 RepID=A0AA40ELJ9_9PEZI|nr:hypothetical protein B0T21DRAFT_345493 [Apiosordaria backusii]